MPPYILFYFVVLLTSAVASAVPVEGFDSIFLIGRGTPTVAVSLAVDRMQAAWLEETYQRTRLIATVPITESIFFHGGIQGDTSPTPWSRSAAFFKSDWKFSQESLLSLKYTYSAWNYLSSSRDLLTFEYSSFFPFSDKSGVYLCLGYFYRWLRQSWNQPWAQPFNWSTDDQQGFISLLLGWQWAFGNNNYWTLDFNNREPFDHHNLDHLAADLTVNWSVTPDLYLNLTTGVRTSSTFVGTIYPAQYQVGLGFTYR
ncbi:MAG: hypothetical protein K2X47_15565 [Bdellovibrionales bacterium]|nr:hypothetical protein [Bdellovibrionales bacterium]